MFGIGIPELFILLVIIGLPCLKIIVVKNKKKVRYGMSENNSIDYVPGGFSERFETHEPRVQDNAVCQECGSVIPEDAKICHKCGK